MMLSFRWLTLTLLVCATLCCATRPAIAQWRSQPRIESASVAARYDPPKILYPPIVLQEKSGPSYGWMITGGVVGGALGAVAGALTATGMGDIATGVRNTTLGAAAGIPVGVHLGNGARGSVATAAAVSIGIAAATLYATDYGNRDVGVILLSAPALELVASILIETATSR